MPPSNLCTVIDSRPHHEKQTPRLSLKFCFLCGLDARMFVEGAVCAGTNLYNKHTPSGNQVEIVHPKKGFYKPCWSQQWPKLPVKVGCYGSCFKYHLPLVRLTAMHCFGCSFETGNTCKH